MQIGYTQSTHFLSLFSFSCACKLEKQITSAMILLSHLKPGANATSHSIGTRGVKCTYSRIVITAAVFFSVLSASYHMQVNCSLCKETLQREMLDLHKSKQCTQRMVACEYCEYELPAVDLHEHQV
jgi:hypothetical protein